MNILHTGDLHFCEDPKLLQDIVKCCDFLLATAARIVPGLSVIAGDIFDEKTSLDSPAVMAAIDFVVALGGISPVLIVRGTPTHDNDSLHVFRKIQSKFPIYVSENIEQVMLTTEEGFKNYKGGEVLDASKAFISCLPAVSKAYLYAQKDMDMQDANLQAANLLSDVFKGWSFSNMEAKAHGIPAILVGHGSLTGATTSTGQQMVGRDLEFSSGELAVAAADVCCLGHIHKAQYTNNIFYSGSLSRLNFGEVEDKGFWIHHVGTGTSMTSEFVKVPARRLITVDIKGVGDLKDFASNEKIVGADIKVRCEVLESDMHKFNDVEIEKILFDAGASSAVVHKKVIPVNRTRAAGIGELKNLEEKIRKWAQTTGVELSEGVIDKVAVLEKDVEEIISEISGSVAPAGAAADTAVKTKEEGQSVLFT